MFFGDKGAKKFGTYWVDGDKGAATRLFILFSQLLRISCAQTLPRSPLHLQMLSSTQLLPCPFSEAIRAKHNPGEGSTLCLLHHAAGADP